APDPIDMVHRGTAIDAYGMKASVILGVSLDRARRMIPATVGALERVGQDRTRLTIGADSLEWLARFILNLPFPLEVEEPEDLKVLLAGTGRDLVEAYG